MMNATIIGPVVPTGGVDDGIPPAKLQNVWAIDTPMMKVAESQLAGIQVMLMTVHTTSCT